jgi:hypothetical protein
MFSNPEARPGAHAANLRGLDLVNPGYPEAGLPDRVGRTPEVIGRFEKDFSGTLLQKIVAPGRHQHCSVTSGEIIDAYIRTYR